MHESCGWTHSASQSHILGGWFKLTRDSRESTIQSVSKVLMDLDYFINNQQS